MAVIERDSFELSERLKNEPIYQWVYRILRANIMTLRLRPGQAVSETEIASRLGISRTPVREAFIRLGEDGLLDVRPQRHSTITRIDLEQAEETRFVRRSLEKSIMKEACQASFFPGLNELEENLIIQESCLSGKDFGRLLMIDNDFHLAIYRRCGKQRIWAFIKKLDKSHDRLRTMTLPLIAETIVGEHREIMNLLAARRSELVDDLIDRHLTNTVISKVILEYPAEYFTQDPRGYAQKTASTG